jgi:DNA-binding IclR family transcriptional regulator
MDRDLPRETLVSMIVGTYREMPGLSLHLRQAARLFGVGAATCQTVLDQLVSAGQLQRMPDGQYRGA